MLLLHFFATASGVGLDRDVPDFPVRTHAGTSVTRGRLNLLPAPAAAGPAVNYSTFSSLLQCAPTEPDLNAQGALSLMRLVPPTRELLALVATWVETGCAEDKDKDKDKDGHVKDVLKDPIPWAACRTRLAAIRAGRRTHRQVCPACLPACLPARPPERPPTRPSLLPLPLSSPPPPPPPSHLRLPLCHHYLCHYLCQDDVDFVANQRNIVHFAWPILLMRATGGRLYYDWPFGVGRFAARGYAQVAPPI